MIARVESLFDLAGALFSMVLGVALVVGIPLLIIYAILT